VGMRVEVTKPRSVVELLAEIRRAELAAAGPVLAAAIEGAPYEPEPRHGVHLNETGYMRFVPGPAGEDRVQVGFTAFWSPWQHERMDQHHEHGHAKFLELAIVEGARGWLERVAEGVRKALIR
jgi:hypothetical protein